MESDERLTALKKAYADIILNTAKEAAAKIMVSERKAIRFQRELHVAKDEALQMLIRLKGLMDSKIHEAEMRSLNQGRQIEELEAQLQEAEDIVKDLREELQEMQAKLEKITDNKLQQVHKVDGTPMEETENRLNSFQSLRFCPESRHGSTPVCDMNLEPRNEGYKYCSINDGSIGIPYACNHDLPSIITRSKEPELYRNGCTQRIRAVERNISDGRFLGSEEIDNLGNGASAKEDEGAHEIFLKPAHKAEIICNTENEEVHADNSWYQVRRLKSIRRKRRRAVRYKKLATLSKKFITSSSRCSPLEVAKENQIVDISCLKSHPNSIDNNPLSDEDHSDMDPKLSLDNIVVGRQSELFEVTESEAEIDRAGSVQNSVFGDGEVMDNLALGKEENGSLDNTVMGRRPGYIEVTEVEGEFDEAGSVQNTVSGDDEVMENRSLDSNVMGRQSGFIEVTEREAEFDKAGSVQNTVSGDKEVIDNLSLTEEESGSPDSSGIKVGTVDQEKAEESLGHLESRPSDTINGISSQPVNDRVIKYTFQRKRKRESMGNSDVHVSLEKSNLGRMAKERQNDPLGPKKCSLITESSRDSQGLAQVAHQVEDTKDTHQEKVVDRGGFMGVRTRREERRRNDYKERRLAYTKLVTRSGERMVPISSGPHEHLKGGGY